MMMRRTVLFLIFFAAVVFACGSNDDASIPNTDGGDAGEDVDAGDSVNFDGGIPSACDPPGTSCSSGEKCCTGTCDATTKKCTGGVGQCSAAGAACGSGTDCCGLRCEGGKCSAAACIQDSKACTTPESCCSGNCSGGVCAPLNADPGACKTAGNACSGAGDCCSKLCKGGTCQLNSSYCIQSGDVCSHAEDCCGGICTKAAGATLGSCSAPSGATYCNGGVDGTVCEGAGCQACCSRLCAPYAPSGVNICQPANGCRVNGDLCRADKDCCGAAGTGLPGAGNVTCDKAPGATVGICRNPQSCNPEGNVCHFKDYVCSVSSARNDCCEHLGSNTNCELDPVGVPRCHVVGVDGGPACRTTSQTCAFSGDCCNGAKCLPDSGGTLRCAPSTTQCSQTGNACSVNADCCSGLTCTTAPGSVKGTCGATTTPDGGTGTCSLYGQACKDSTECCNGVPCNGGFCVTIVH